MQIKTSSTRFLVLLIGFVTICSADCGKGRQRSESCGGSSVIRKVRGAYDDAFSISTDRMQKIAMLITGIRIQNQLLSGTLNADSFLEGLLGFESPPVQIANPEKLKALIQALRVLAASLSAGDGDKPTDKLKLLEEKLEAIEAIRKLTKNAGTLADSKEYLTQVNRALSGVNETLLNETMEDAIATWQRVAVKIDDPNFSGSYFRNYLEQFRKSASILKEHGAKLAEMCNLTIPSATRIISMLEGMGIVKKFSGKADSDGDVISAVISEISSAAKVAKAAKVEVEAVKAMFSGRRRSEGLRDMVLALRDPWVNKIVPLEAMERSLAPLLRIIESVMDSQDVDPSSPSVISFLSQVQNLINFPEDPEPLYQKISTCSSTMSTLHFKKDYEKFIESAKSLESQVKEVHETLCPFSMTLSSQETSDQLQEVIRLCTISGNSTTVLKAQLDTLKGSEAFKDLTGMLNGSGKRIVTFSKMKNFRQSAMEIDSNRLAIIADLDTFHASEFYQCLTSLQHGTLVAIWRQFRGLEGRSIVETGENLFRSSGEDAVDLKTLREEVLEAKGKSTKETEALKSLNKLSPHATVLGLATKGLVAMKYALENRMHAELVMRSGPVIQKYMPIIDQELSQKLEAIVQLNTSLETLYQKLEQWSDGVKETDNESTMLSAYSEVFTSALSIPDVPGDLKDMQLTVLKVQDTVPQVDNDLDSLFSSLMALDRYGLQFSNFKVAFDNKNNSKEVLEAMDGFFAAYKAQVAGFTGSHGTGAAAEKSKRTRVQYVMWPSWLLVTSGLISGLAMIVFFSVCFWKGFPRKNRQRLGPSKLEKSMQPSGSPSKSNSTSKSGNGTSKSSESSSTPPKAKSV